MPTQKWCNVAGCKKFIFVKLDDLADNEWSAFKIGKGKVLCFCPNHQKEMMDEMENKLNKHKEKK
jgi:hypothetical protein